MCLAVAVAACGDGRADVDAAADSDAALERGWSSAPALPVALANNAVAAMRGDEGCTVYTALGIDATLQPGGIVRSAYAWHVGDAQWTELPDVPGAAGRVAASAVTVRGKLYVFGGYSVAAGGAETSHDAVDVYDPAVGGWSSVSPLPIPIDDAVAVAWRDRWIVVVTGWSNTGNVDAVQIYDVEAAAWSAGTRFPGSPVFGSAGAVTGDQLVIIDGVRSGVTGFSLVNQAWRGDLDPDDPTRIQWTELGPHSGPARYRAAGGALPDGRLLFQGGTDDPYNYDGLSYGSGQPSPPLGSGLIYDINGFSAHELESSAATMDHRALAECGDELYVVGGMTAGPTVTADVWRLRP